MADSGLATLGGVITRLKAVTAVTDLVSTRIYTAVPQGDAIYPFIRVSIDSADNSTKSYAGMNNLLRIQAFSRYNGIKEVLQIRSAVEDALNRQEANVSIAGFSLVRLERATLATTFIESDGKTWQSVIEFECVTQ